MEKYVQSLLDRLPDDKKKYLLMIMDSAINEMHNNGILSQLPPELMAKVHNPDPQVRVTEKTSLAKSVGYSFVEKSNPGADENGVNHNITINNNEKFPASIAICIQGGLEGLYMSELYTHNPSGKMNYNITINSNNQDTSKFCEYIEIWNELYDMFNIAIVERDAVKETEESEVKSDEVKTEIKKQKKILKITKPITIQCLIMLPISLIMSFEYKAFEYIFLIELVIFICDMVFVSYLQKRLKKKIYRSKATNERQQVKTVEKSKEDIIVDKIKERQPNENEHKCSKCGNVQSKSISRCLRCSNLITEAADDN